MPAGPTPEQLALQQQINAAIEKSIELHDELAKASAKAQTPLQASLAKQQAKVSALQQQIALLNQSDAQLQSIISKNKAILDVDEEKSKLTANEIQGLQNQNALLGQMINAGEGLRRTEANRLTTSIQQTAELAKQAAAFSSLTQKIGGAMGLGTSFNQTILGGMSNALGGISMQLQGIVQNLKQTGGLARSAFGAFGAVAAPMISATEQMMFAQDSMRAQFVRSTGASERFTGSLMGASNQLKNMQLDFRAAGAAQTELYNSMLMFKGATESTRTQLTLFVSKLTEAGVDLRSSVGALEFFTNNMRMAEGTARRLTGGLVSLASTLGMNVNQVMSQFNALAPQLAAHGSKMHSVFVQLTAQSRATGISMQNLVNIAAQFDTFEGSANAVARLNGILGGTYLNSLKMVFATESQRMSMMHQSLQLSGRAFDSLSRYERKALAAAAGFQSVGQAQKFFNNSLNQYQGEAARAAAKAKQWEDLLQRAKPLAERLRLAMMQLAVSMGPLITKLTNLIGSLGRFVANESVQTVIQIGAIVTVAYKLTTAIRGAAAAFTALKLASAASLVGFGAVAAGVGFLAAAFSAEHSPPVYQLPSVMASGLSALASTAAQAVQPMRLMASTAASAFRGATTQNVDKFTKSIRGLAGMTGQLHGLGSVMKDVGGASRGFVFGMQVAGFEDVVRAADKLKEIGPEATQTVAGFSQMVRTTAQVETKDASNAVSISRAANDWAKASINVRTEGARAITNMIMATGGGGGGGATRVQPPQKVINQPINFQAGGRNLASAVLKIINERGDIRVAT